MSDETCACSITRENRSAIASENPWFDLDEFDAWLVDHAVGYFVRDPGTPFDCKYMSEFVFLQMYEFEHADVSALFRRTKRTS